MKRCLTLFISFLFFAQTLMASGVGARQKRNKASVDSKKIYRTFSADEHGIEAILEELKEEKPAVYARVKTRGENLISDINTAKYISYGTIAVGTIALVAGFSKFMSKSSDNNSDEDDKNASQGMTLIGASLVLFWGGSAIASAFAPSEQDMNNFINLHNKLNPTDQLQRTEYKFWFDYDPKIDSTKLALNINF